MKVQYILLAAMCYTTSLCSQAQVQTFVRSKVLIEKHTGKNCPNCPDGDRLFGEYMTRHPEYDGKVFEMRHNNYFPPDVYYVDFQRQISNMWEVDGWPRYYADRCHPKGWRYESAKQYGLSRGEFAGDETDPVGRRLATPTSVSISFEGSGYNPATKTINVRLKGEVTQSLPDLHVNIFLVQELDGFEGSSRAFLTRSVHGDWLPVSHGNYDVVYTYDIPDVCGNIPTKPEDMQIVAFISSFDEKDFTYSEVHNCDVVRVTSLPNITLPARSQCNMPSISVRDHELVFESSTPDAIYFYNVTSSITAENVTSDDADLSQVHFTVKAYAGAPGYTDSPENSRTFNLLDLIGDIKDINGDGKISISDVPNLINIMK